MFFLGIDPLYWMMMIPVLILSAIASMRVKATFSKYSRIGISGNLTGADAAREILRMNGLHDVDVVKTTGFLSDHYDPRKKIVRLSSKVFDSNSIAAVGVAAHETGHALQHAQSYTPLMLRNAMVPVASIGSNFSWIIIMAGFFLGMLGLVKLGIVLFSIVVVFQIITLPVEFNASARAKRILAENRIVNRSELTGVNQVLSSAAMTYVAAAAGAVMTLLYFLLRSGLLGGRSD